MRVKQNKDRIATVRDVLYCDDHCSKEAYKKIIDMWSGDHIADMEKTSHVSALRTEELSLMNRLFGSDATCYSISEVDLQKDLLAIMPFDLYKNFRRATYKRPQAVSVEDWIWISDEKEFLAELDIELTCLENAIVSLILYLLGGFKIPRDEQKKKMDDWIQVDIEVLLGRPRELFLLTSMSPAILSRYVYWKCTSVLMGLMRHFSLNVTLDKIEHLQQQLESKGILDGSEIKNR